MAVSFAVENTLGKLAKWLRILGFDAIFDAGAGGPDFFRRAARGRVLLTRNRSMQDQVPSERLMLIRSDHPAQQLIEVIRHLNIAFEDVRPLTRCIECNQLIDTVQKATIRDIVPDFVYETHEEFRQCPRCRKVFWPGSHASRVAAQIRQLFEKAGSDDG